MDKPIRDLSDIFGDAGLYLEERAGRSFRLQTLLQGPGRPVIEAFQGLKERADLALKGFNRFQRLSNPFDLRANQPWQRYTDQDRHCEQTYALTQNYKHPAQHIAVTFRDDNMMKIVERGFQEDKLNDDFEPCDPQKALKALAAFVARAFPDPAQRAQLQSGQLPVKTAAASERIFSRPRGPDIDERT